MTSPEPNAGNELLALADCPFCGKQPYDTLQNGTVGRGGTYKHVWCIECGAQAGEHIEEAVAIKAWNTRAALRRAASEPVEPVAWQIKMPKGTWHWMPTDWTIDEALEGKEYRPLYTHPAPTSGALPTREAVAHRVTVEIRPERGGDVEYWRIRGIVSRALAQPAAAQADLTVETSDGYTVLTSASGRVKKVLGGPATPANPEARHD